MASFRHLTRAEISEIIEAYNGGETKAEIARRHGIDHSTVIYHINKYERAYPEQGGVYAVIKTQARKVCIHPSMRCSLCGEMADLLLRQERDQIAILTYKLKKAQESLRAAGIIVE